MAARLPRNGCTATRTIMVWSSRALFVGAPFHLEPHRTSVAVLCLGLDGSLRVGGSGDAAALRYRHCANALVPAGLRHHVLASGSVAFLYLDPFGADLAAVDPQSDSRADRVTVDLAGLDGLRSGLLAFSNGDAPPAVVAASVNALFPRTATPWDQRVEAIVAAMVADPASAPSSAGAAAAAGLSPSRFQHLFKAKTGVPYSRFRLWCRLRHATLLATRGSTWTIAAHAAGFASSAHLTRTFREMFGLPPRALDVATLRVIVHPEDYTASNRLLHARAMSA